jgi:methylated-DNA-[protein]-cysteine S-methyltransferase
MYFETTNSTLGPLTLFAAANNIIALEFGSVAKNKPTPILKEAITQLKAYLNGQLTHFNLPIKTSGTDFQQAVWDHILKIPYGTTLSYGALAQKLKSAPRAIGAACGKNPIPIIVPCHRVLAANYKIGGFSVGDGISTKASLLRIEGINRKL